MEASELKGKNHYEILGVDAAVPVERIKEVYRDLARVYHPDSNFYDEILSGTDGHAESEVFKIMTASYNVLIDANQRREYDKHLESLRLSDKIASWDKAEEPGSRRIMSTTTAANAGGKSAT